MLHKYLVLFRKVLFRSPCLYPIIIIKLQLTS